jgi:FAD/FMN-containing dehydrogenase
MYAASSAAMLDSSVQPEKEQRMEPTTTNRDPVLTRLEERISGEVIRPGDKCYDTARALWNAMIDNRPALIVQPRTAEEVATTILCARETELEIAIRCGGHSFSGESMAEDGLTIDLSAMNAVSVDPVSATARVGGGALLNDVGEAGLPHALAMPFGQISHTGVGGLTLGGGVGWVMRRYGLAIDSVLSAELVTAEGQVVRASEDENPDLFWALRGGGGNFGVVTEFEFQLHPFGPEVLAGMLLHSLEDAGDAVRFSRDFMESAPNELTLFETFLSVPPEEPFPTELHGRPAMALGLVYAGPVADGERVLRPLREFGHPALDLVAPMPALAVQQMLDPTAPPGMRNYQKAHWLAELPDEAIDEQVRRHAEVPSPMSLIINGRVGGAVERVPHEDTAFGHRSANRLLLSVGAWWEGDDAEQIEWARGVFDAMTPYSTGGVYVNFLGDEGLDRTRAGYADDVWRKLVAVKDRWDPDNVFHRNQNIPPSKDGTPA